MSKKYIIKNGTAVEVSEELHDYLTKSDRKIRYIEKDLKRNNYIIDSENEKVTVIPSREDSLDRLMDIGKDYPNQSSDFRQSTIEKIMLEKALEDTLSFSFFIWAEPNGSLRRNCILHSKILTKPSSEFCVSYMKFFKIKNFFKI